MILWLVYGILLHATAVIVANAVSILLVATAIVMKAIIANPPGVTLEGAPRTTPHTLNPRILVQSLSSRSASKRQKLSRLLWFGGNSPEGAGHLSHWTPGDH